MGIQRSREDSWTKEMAKWEQNPVLVGDTFIQPIPFADGGRGGAPRLEYPKMLYRADSFDGGPRISETKIVEHDGAERLAAGAGWRASQEDAIKDVHARHQEFARLAAERAHTERWMSPKAQAEAAAVDESTMQHVPVIPETPIRRKPGPKPNVQTT